jgi:predicted nucleotidyltransferase
MKQSETPQAMPRTIPSPAPKGFEMKEEILKKLQELKPTLYEKYGIESFAIFGSVAKGEENENSDINIDHKEIVVYLAKQKGIKLKESFGEDEKGAYFSLKVGDESITLRGKSIKSLRKKVYKKALEIIIGLRL